MSLPEVVVRNLLNGDAGLNAAINKIRGKAVSPQPIYTYEIPESFQSVGVAPMIRVTPINDVGALYADDIRQLTEYTVQVDCWAKFAADVAQLQKNIDQILRKQGWEAYYSDRYRDPDLTGLIMNVREYRYVGNQLE